MIGRPPPPTTPKSRSCLVIGRSTPEVAGQTTSLVDVERASPGYAGRGPCYFDGQRTAIMITSGGNRNPVNSDLGADTRAGQRRINPASQPGHPPTQL
jgi:hypothetical protein